MSDQNAVTEEHKAEPRKGLCGAIHPAKRVNAIIFPDETPKHSLNTDPAFIQKLKSGGPLSNEERNEALYHPHLFQQARGTAQAELSVKPWELGLEKVSFHTSRKHVEPRLSSAAEPQEAQLSSGKRMVKQASPQKEAPEKLSRKHISPRKSSEEANLFMSPKKHIEGVRPATIDLSFDANAQEDSKQKYSRKQVAAVRTSLINLKLDDATEGPVDNVRTLRKLKPTENKSAAEKCPFGTDYTSAATAATARAKPPKGVSNTYRSSIDLGVGGSTTAPAAGGVAMFAHPPQSHGNILSWN